MAGAFFNKWGPAAAAGGAGLVTAATSTETAGSLALLTSFGESTVERRFKGANISFKGLDFSSFGGAGSAGVAFFNPNFFNKDGELGALPDSAATAAVAALVGAAGGGPTDLSATAGADEAGAAGAAVADGGGATGLRATAGAGAGAAADGGGGPKSGI